MSMLAKKSTVYGLSAILILGTVITTVLAVRAMREAEERQATSIDAAYEVFVLPELFDTANVADLRLAEHSATERSSQVAGTWTNSARLPSRERMGRGNPVGVIDRSPRREPWDKGALPRCSPGRGDT